MEVNRVTSLSSSRACSISPSSTSSSEDMDELIFANHLSLLEKELVHLFDSGDDHLLTNFNEVDKEHDDIIDHETKSDTRGHESVALTVYSSSSGSGSSSNSFLNVVKRNHRYPNRNRFKNAERELQPDDKGFMDKAMENTNTYIQWPSRMKIGAKTKKDLFVRIYGHNQDDINEAKNQILQDLGPHRDLRITLKMEISYTDHSHLIGCRGATIRKVMEDTGCHIHFPDSNRMSKEHKSNQVTIAGGSIQAVEEARSRVRELSPLIFQFNLPVLQHPHEMHMDPDSHHIFIDNIQSTYNVQVTIHPPNKLQQTTVSVKGCEVDSSRIKEAVAQIINYFAPGTIVSSILVESAMEISAAQHSFVRAVNDSNIHAIMMNTGAKIIFPDLSDNNIQQIKRSRVFITGEINSVYYARQQLIGCLPLRMIFEVSDDFQPDWDAVRTIGTKLSVSVKLINRNTNRPSASPGITVNLPPQIPGKGRTLQLISAERNTGNIYEARRQILGGVDHPFIAIVPTSYALRPIHPPGLHQFGNRLSLSPLTPLLFPATPNMSPVLSPSFWPPQQLAPPLFRSPIHGKEQTQDLSVPPGFAKLKPIQLNSPSIMYDGMAAMHSPGSSKPWLNIPHQHDQNNNFSM